MVKRKWLKGILIFFGALFLILFAGPFLVPVPPLENTLSPEQLADSDSRFIDVLGIEVHYKISGSGEPIFLLLHGFGASTFSWREVMGPLSKMGTVIAFDRPGFGLTERPMPEDWKGMNPYSPEAQVRLTLGLLDALGIERAIFVGNSAGGTVSLQVAVFHPERVQALILVDAAVYSEGGIPWFLHLLFQTPQMNHLGPLLARQIRNRGEELIRMAWHDPSKITPEILEGYTKPLKAKNWDRALWELTRANRSLSLEERLKEIRVPVLVITGDDDRIVPKEESIRLSQEIPQSDLVIIPNCGHLPQEECPEAFLEALQRFLKENRL